MQWTTNEMKSNRRCCKVEYAGG